MSPLRSCPHETAVLGAQRTGEWSAALRGHAESCPGCADALLAASYFGALATDVEALARDQADLPDPSRLLWRARLRQRADAAAGAASRATWPIRLLNRLTAAVGVVAAAGLLVHQRPRLGGWFASLRRSVPLETAATASPEALALAAGGLLFALLLFALYSSWAEE